MKSNLTRRLLVGAVGIPILLYCAVSGGWALFVLVLLLQAASLWEWQSLCAANHAAPNAIGGILGAVGVDILIFRHGDLLSVGIALLALSMLLLIEVFRRERQPLRDLSAEMLLIAYVILPLALWYEMSGTAGAHRWEPIGALAILMVTTWTCDTAAYAFGRLLGRRKLDVKASPNKTVEGFAAGLIFSAAVLPIMALLGWADPTMPDYLMLPLIVGIGGQIGDLLESLMKREAQVKDTSSILPGHGGVLDRFDSLFVSSPLLFAYLILSSM